MLHTLITVQLELTQRWEGDHNVVKGRSHILRVNLSTHPSLGG
ncbi:hypothetical protein [Phormidesmis priestleyi]